MDNPTILVADGDPKNLQILRESLEASGFEVIVASDGLQAWQKISSDVPDLILSEVNLPKLDGFQLLEKLKADPVTSSIPLMFLTNRRELQDRVRSLRGGVKDYMIKPLHVKEVIARVRMILRRMERIREEEIESTRKLAGRLEEFSVIDLIENFGMERKTGILALYNASNKSGEIYFRDGAVINASLANLKAEKAVYQMLPWKRGHFTMTFKEINVPDEIAVSNLGLLLQGFKRMEERERLFKMLPSPETTFVTTETFRNIVARRELTTDVERFIALIDGKRDILQVIDESNYDDIKTLERMVKLYQQGFIKPNKTSLAGDDDGDMVSTLAEPKIIEKLDFEGVESRFGGGSSEKEKLPQSFRGPNVPTYTPPERRRQETPGSSVETKHDVPVRPRPVTPIVKPPAPPTEIIGADEYDINMDDFGEDPSPAEPPAKIDLRDLMQRPTALPILDKPVAPREYEPPPKVEKPVARTLEYVPPAPEVAKPSSAIKPPTIDARREFPPPPVDAKSLPTEVFPVEPELPEINTKTIIINSPEEMEQALTRLQKSEASPVSPAAPTVIEPVQIRSEPVALMPTQIEPIVPPKPSVVASTEALMSKRLEPTTPETAAPATVQPALPAQPIDAITTCLAQLLKNRPAAKPKLVIIGREGQHVSPMLRQILGAESSLRRMQSAVFQYLEIGERKLEARPFEIIGISMEQQFTRLLDTAGADLLGYVVMIEAHRKERIEYLSYLVNMLNSVYRRPLGIGIIKSPDQKNMSPETLRDLLNMGTADFLQECMPTDKLSVTEFLQGFTSEANLQRWSAQSNAGGQAQ